MRTTVFLLCLAVSSIACTEKNPAPEGGGSGGDVGAGGGSAGSGGSGGSGGEVVPPSFERDVCAPLATEICSRKVACACSQAGGAPVDEPACLAHAQAACEKDLAYVAEWMAAGAVLDPVAVARCIADSTRAAGPCATPSLSDECAPWILSPARFFASCSSGARCADGAGICEEAVCRRLPSGFGEACTGACAAGKVCRHGTCRDAQPAGETCSETGGACEYGLECVDGECGGACLGKACPPRTGSCLLQRGCAGGACVAEPACALRLEQGAACTESRQCRAGMLCDRIQSRCVAPLGEGSKCSRDGLCGTGFTCDVSFDCTAGAAQGLACRTSYDGKLQLCASDLLCYSGRCDAARGAGGKCADDGRCPGALRCQKSTGTCGTTELGDPCATHEECGPLQHCAGGTCQLRGASGADCATTADCQDGLDCRRGPTGLPSCQDPSPDLAGPCGFVCGSSEQYCAPAADGMGTCQSLVCQGG